MNTQYEQLVTDMRSGDVPALSRMISMVENNTEAVPLIMKEICRYKSDSYCIGITGPPGAGKSTTVANITSILREKELSVGIICADPSSPFSGGAILGDRVRMQKHYLDEKVFIRSMSTRGSHGGLPGSTINVINLLRAFRKDYIIVETVGVGQTELDIMKSSDTTIVVLTPESGDSIQALKAGLMEVAEIFVVNKSDRPGADDMATLLKHMLHSKVSAGEWDIPVVQTNAHENNGTEVLIDSILRHRQWLENSGRLTEKRQRQRRQEFMMVLEARIRQEFLERINSNPALQTYLNKVECGDQDIYSATEEIVRNILRR